MEIGEFVLIIGAMKGGTTSLFRHLSQHPQIASSSSKEPHYFSKDEHFAKGREWYMNHWSFDPAVHRIAMEASASYTKVTERPHTVERIAAFGGSFRFIYILRDPIDRIESHYAHEVKKGLVQDVGTDVPQRWIDRSKYAMQLLRYTERFPRSKILLLDFDELRASPMSLLRKACRFMGVDEDFEFKGAEVKHNFSRRDHPAVRFLWERGWARRVAKLVPLPIKQTIRLALSSELEVSPKLTLEQRRFAQRALTDDVRRLRDEYGFDTSRWSVTGSAQNPMT